jgi:para-nitrobenzyl esterase
MVAPLAKGLFSRALMESGACIAGPKATRESEGAQVAIKAGCADEMAAPGCLRALSAEKVMRAVPATVSVASPGLNNYGPVIDGYVLTGQPWEVIAAGGHNHVPFIIGSNSDETSMAVGAVPTCQQFAAGVRNAYPAIAAQILELYPCTAYATPRKAATAVSTDARFICTALLSSRSAAKGQSEGVYRYQYSHPINSPLLKELGAWHGGEIPFVFQHVNISGYRPDAGDTATANAVLKYWTRFAATGDPNGEGTPRWDRYDAAKDNYINIDSTTSAAAGLRTEQCAFWSKVAGLEAP